MVYAFCNILCTAYNDIEKYTYYNAPKAFRGMIKIIGDMLCYIAGYGTTEDVNAALKPGVTYDATTQELMGKMYDIIAPLAIGFLCLYFLCFFLDKVANGEAISTDMIFKSFLKFIVCFGIITNCENIITYFFKFGDALAEVVSNLIESTNGTDGEEFRFQVYDEVADYIIKRHGTIQWGSKGKSPETILTNLWGLICAVHAWVFRLLGSFCWILIPWLLCKAIYIVTLTVSITRLLELFIRSVFAPFAIANTAFDQSDGWGKRYLKQYLAISIQGAVILGIVVMIGAVSGISSYEPAFLVSLMDGLTSYKDLTLWTTAVFRLAGTALIMKSRDLCNDIVGV